MVRALVSLLIFAVTFVSSYGETPFDPSATFRAVTAPPKLDEERRAWMDGSGQKAFVGWLQGRDSGELVIKRVDGSLIKLGPRDLWESDRNYAWQATEPRVNPEATVWLGKVISVMDGDTLQFQTLSNELINIRLDGIDAPEKGQEYCEPSTAYLERIKGRIVRVEFEKRDGYRRPLADIYIGDRWVNFEMAVSGYAYHYLQYNTDQRLMAAEDYARSLKRGVWEASERILPWDWRNGVRKPTDDPLIAPDSDGTGAVVFVTESGTSYHCEGCRYAKDAIEIPLSRAISAYKQCGICNPDENCLKKN